MKKNIVIIFLLFSLISCVSLRDSSENSVTPSLLNLNSQEFNNKTVRVRGWVRVGFEKYGIWQDVESIRNGTFAENCVSLMLPESENYTKFNMSYVEIEGVFLEKLPEDVFLSGRCNATVLLVSEGVRPIRIRYREGRRTPK